MGKTLSVNHIVTEAMYKYDHNKNGAIDLKRQRDPQEQQLLLREEQRRQQQRQGKGKGNDERFDALPGHEVNADNTVPVVPLMGEPLRQGLLVDIEV